MEPLRQVDAAATASQSYAIDQTRYFASPEIEQADLKASLAEVTGIPSVAPADPKTLLEYLRRC